MHVSIKDAKDRLSELVRSAERGETAVITRNGKPVADIVPHFERKGGVDFGVIERHIAKHGPIVTQVAPDFDDLLPDSFWFGDDD